MHPDEVIIPVPVKYTVNIRNYRTHPLSGEEKADLRYTRKYKLLNMIEEWQKIVSEALIRVENRRRAQTNLKPYPENTPTLIPTGPNADLWMMNLRVWCLRYCISPEFIIEALTRRLKYLRKTYSEDIIALGLPAAIMGGAKARQFIEDEVMLQYPNGENYKIEMQPEPPPIRIKPHITPDQMVANYSQAIEDAQRKRQRHLRLMSRIPTRPYRQSPKESI